MKRNRPNPTTKAREVLIRFDHKPTLEEVVASFGNVKLVPANLHGRGLWLEFYDGENEILYNENDPVSEQRITIAHELGHIIRGIRTPSVVTKDGLRFLTKDWLEDWCDAFALCLLEGVGG